MSFLNEIGLERLWTHILVKLGTKVDKVDGKDLSTNDYTTEEKEKLATIEPEANFYEHPEHTSHSSGLYKITVDGEGHVSDVSLAAKEDIVALGIPAQDTTYDTEISELSDKIDGVENSINTTNETLAGVSQEFESYKTTNNDAVSTNTANIDTLQTALDGKAASGHTHSAATTSTAGLMSATDKAKLDSTNVSYGTCNTAADVAAKVVSLSGNTNWKLTTGSIIMVSFTNTNTAEGVTINVNNTGAYPIWYNASEYTSTGNAYTGYAGRVTTYMFNGTHWVWVSNSYDANTQSNTNSTDTSNKIFLVGATSQGSNKTTYSHDTVYAGTDGHVYSNSKQVVNLSDSQALTNKTYNGYTLGAACAKGVATSATSGNSNLITSGAVYSAVNGGHNHQAESIAPGAIEFHPGSSAGHGGYIDFHYNDSTSDYTSRIIESPSGTLTLNGNKILTKADIVDVYNATITFTNGVATYSNSAIKSTSVCIVQRRGGSAGANLSFCTTSNAGSVTICTNSNYNGATAVNMTISNL